MFRKSITLMAAIAAVGALALVATPSNAKPGNGNGGVMQNGGNPGMNPGNKGGNPGNKNPDMGNKGGNWNWKWGYNHKYWYGYGYYPYYRNYYYASAPVVTTTRGPCTCLTKNYTPEGQVIFKDLCTNEMAAGPVAGSPSAEGPARIAPQSAVQPQQNVAQADPSNFAGRTFQDFQAQAK